jgi:hypothetical protein
MAQTTVVYLTPEELREADEEGNRRNSEDIAMGLSIGGMFDMSGDGGFEQHRIGTRAERVMGKFFGMHDFKFAPMKGVDVGGYQVRGTSLPKGSLIVRPKDAAEERFALVTRLSHLGFRVVGWLFGRDAKQGQWTRNPGGHGKAWFVPWAPLIQMPRTPLPPVLCPGCSYLGRTKELSRALVAKARGTQPLFCTDCGTGIRLAATPECAGAR